MSKAPSDSILNPSAPTQTATSLSARVRPNVEAAPWVYEAIQELEAKLAAQASAKDKQDLEFKIRSLENQREILRTELKNANAALRDAMETAPADTFLVRNALETLRRRSSYHWTEGGSYKSSDYMNEGSIRLAAQLLDDASLWSRPDSQETQQMRKLKDDDVEWVVNDIAELGVKIGDQFFFLYKAGSLVYKSGKHDDGKPMLWRYLGKREFGEVCHPWTAIELKEYGDIQNRERVRLPDTYVGYHGEGIEEWKPLPTPTSDVSKPT